MKNTNRSLILIVRNLLAIWISIVALTHFNIAHAATAEQEKRIAQCPDGQYAGPGTGAKRFLQDPYVWFVSREFAKRFCVPEQLIDDSLKGALAVAVIIKPDDRTYCGLYAGRSDVCTNKPRLLLEIYVDNRKANIPKADPRVEYFSGHIVNSGKFFGDPDKQMQRRNRGEYRDPDGVRRPFTPAEMDQKDTTMFHYLGVRKGWATGAGAFIEQYYRANWVDGIDLISLDAYNFGYGGARNPDLKIQTDSRGGRGYYQEKHDQTNPIQRWAIGVILGKDFLKDPDGDERRSYPEGYLHTIELPHKVAQMIYAYDHKQGEQFFSTIKRAITPTAPSTSPAQ
jgi:hypothetical protein